MLLVFGIALLIGLVSLEKNGATSKKAGKRYPCGKSFTYWYLMDDIEFSRLNVLRVWPNYGQLSPEMNRNFSMTRPFDIFRLSKFSDLIIISMHCHLSARIAN